MTNKLSIKKIFLASTAILSGMLLTATVAFAVNGSPMSLNITESGNVHLKGTVSAVSGSTVSVTSWGGTWTVNTLGATIPSGLTEVKVGDHVKVNGKITGGMNITATTLTDHTKNPNETRRTISGTVSNLNVTAGTFTLATQNSGNVNIATNATTKVYLSGNLSTLASLSNGATATVHGSWNSTTNILTASTVKSPKLQAAINTEFHGKFKGIFKLFEKFSLWEHAEND
ncbi:MAG: DUF5666 domain-containing protein [bacterium]|nr:DUF5666 domain-containing protein [bacterium]